MSTCISRHGEYGSHTFGEGSERFICQRCAVLDEDAMLAALATAEAEVERLRAENDEQKRLLLDETYRPEGGEIVMRELAKVKAEWDEWRMKAEVNTEAADRLGRMLEEAEAERDELRAAQAEHDLLTVSGVEDLANKLARTEDEVERLTAERDALSARLQAVRDLHQPGTIRVPVFDEFDSPYGRGCERCKTGWPCATIRALGASPGTPGDGLAADLADRRADSEFRQRLTERVATDQHILRRLGTPGEEKPNNQQNPCGRCCWPDQCADGCEKSPGDEKPVKSSGSAE